ncbi:hypothetical protein [Tetragenococcus halophilus]|uniref:hypothetical protein n=1 Tax=Tetragenococcus halophilus TaxID=51669 RepID=UPI0015C0D7FA|nr:hypothetical protein [Tetragenococcus halophilus]NWN99273.1 hypothetical protein [Tetragenococcus halophilus]
MKAYVVGNKEEPEIGNEVIYAKNTKEARRVAHSTDIAEESEFIDVEVHRAYEFDNTEDFSKKEFMKLQWKEGWWFEEPGAPDPWSSSEEVFYKWYDKTFAYLYE